MYKEYFLMQTEPFAPFPSPQLFYKSRGHEKAWKQLLFCLQKKEPVVMTAGEYGTGKTLLGLKLIRLMKKRIAYPMVYIPSPGYNFSMLLEKIAKELGLPVDSANAVECQRFLYEYFENDPPEQNKYIYIVVDDIQEFDHAFVSQLSKLITYNSNGYFPIKLFMFGHVSFLQSLDKRNLISFKQRIKTIPLSPLNLAEVTEYIYFRLISSGASGSPVFNEQAIELIASASMGLPRLINKICDNSLSVACGKKMNFIDRKMVEIALGESVTGYRESFQEVTHGLKKDLSLGIGHVSEPPKGIEENRRPFLKQNLSETVSRTVPQREVFTEPDSGGKAQNRKERKPKDLKKKSFLDTKNLLIICLLLIITLMVLFLFRDIRIDTMSTSGIDLNEKYTGIVTKPILRISSKNHKNILIYKVISRKGSGTKGKSFFIPLADDFQTDKKKMPTIHFLNEKTPVSYTEIETEEYKTNG